MGNFCSGCIYWEKVTPIVGDSFGICHNVGVSMKVALDGKVMLGEGGTIWTAAYFGCIYWRNNSGVLIDITKEIKGG